MSSASRSHGDACGDVGHEASVDLFWIPLGAGSPIVQASGHLFEAVSALLARRPRSDLYHAALIVSAPSGRYAIEQAPVPDDDGASRGVVAAGPVGVRTAGRWRIFRYEVRRWLDGDIPDIGEAVESPVHLTDDVEVAHRILDVLPTIPTPVWGRDEAGTGEMWNSNSVISWTLLRSGLDITGVAPPAGGRAPGWAAGVVVAQTQHPSGAPPVRTAVV